MNIVNKMLMGTLALASLVSCAKEDLIEIDNEKSEIRLNAGVEETTKAPIDNTFSTNFSCGVYAKDVFWLAGSSANWINNDSSTVAGAAGHAITFSRGTYYYPSNGDTVTFYVFAPFASETTAAGAGTSPQVTHHLTGQEDVMWATGRGQKVGSDPVSHPALSFSHKLTQLQFTFKADLTYVLSNKVVSLKVKSQPSSAVMNVETGVCTFSGSTDMQALSTANQASGIPITLAGTNALSPVMTQAQTGSTAYLLDIVVKPLLGGNVTYSNIPVNVNAAPGSVHMVTLTFKLLPILPILSVSTWNPSVAGTGTVN